MPASDRRILWDPRRGPKFIVGGGSQLTLYEWTPEQAEIQHVTAKHDLEHMKCFAWSPDPTIQDLIAVGYSTGRLELLRLEAAKHARQSNMLHAGPTAMLNLRNARSVNALSFCKADSNYLAVGLDKVRGDCSLVVFDLASTMPAMAYHGDKPPDASSIAPRPFPLLPHFDLGPKLDRRIVQQHAPSDVVSALTFLPQSTNLILASMSSRYLRLFDLRTPVPAQNTNATNVALKVVGMTTDPFDPTRVACFGENIVTLWDTRKLALPVLTFSEKDAAADGGRGHSQIPYSAVEFSSTRRGVLATFQRGSHYVRMWDIMSARPTQPSTTADGSSDGQRTRDSSAPPANRATAKRSWANLPWSGSNPSDPNPHSEPGLVLSDTRRSKIFTKPLTSFALVPSQGNINDDLTTNLMAVNAEGDLEFHALFDAPKQACWSARGDLAIGAGRSYRVISALSSSDTLPSEPWEIPIPQRHRHGHSHSQSQSRSRGRENRRSPDPNASRAVSLVKTNLAATRPFSPSESNGVTKTGLLSRSMSRPTRAREPPPPSLALPRAPSRMRKHAQQAKGVGAVVEDDISMVMRTRVVAGYGLNNPALNARIVASTSDPSSDFLEDLWSWIEYSRNLLGEPTPMIYGYDFSYEGLLSIWEGLDPDVNGRTPVQVHRDLLSLPEEENQGSFVAALKELLVRGNVDPAWVSPVTTAKHTHRQVALLLLGWSMKDADLKKDVERWEENGKVSRAACWLVFKKHYSKAVEVLLRSEDENHHMMSGMLAALAAQRPHSMESGIREHCERLIVKLQDPYLRAILIHLALGDWTEVLEEELIPFRERLAVAFQFLEDKPLSSYLRRVKDRQYGGEIDALVVTGLKGAGMNVIQAYVDKSGDIQTAAILASYKPKLDGRGERWVAAYRDLLDGFRLFHHRVDFDVCRGGQEVARSILIRCNYCNKAITDEQEEEGGGTQVNTKPRKATVCPHCSRSLPRCTVCLMPLSLVPDAAREVELTAHSNGDTLDDAIVICQTCRHGGHAAHVMDWFFDEEGNQAHPTCAVADCDCPCADMM